MNLLYSYFLLHILCLTSLQLWADLGAIRQSGAANTLIAAAAITQSGNYQLGNDISGTVTISADNVYLNLNNKRITATTTGINITARQNITIENGILTDATQAGIFVSTSTNIVIKNVELVTSVTGLFISASSAISLENSVLMRNTRRAIIVANSSNININNNIVVANTTLTEAIKSLINIRDSSDVYVTKLLANNNNVDNASSNSDIYLIERCNNISLSDSSIDNNFFSAGGGIFSLIRCVTVTNLFLSDCRLDNNSQVTLAISLNPVTNGFLDSVVINNNAGVLFTGIGIGATTCNNIVCSNCVISNNSSSLFLGISMNSSNDILLRKNQVISNTATVLTNNAFNANASVKPIIDSCKVTDNVGTTSMVGINLSSCTDACILNTLIKRNSATSGAAGTASNGIFNASNCTRTTIRDNIVVDNTSPVGSFGIASLSSSSVVWTNQAQGHTTSNFVGLFPIIPYTASIGEFDGTPTPYDNINVT